MSPDEYHEQMQTARAELTLFDEPQAVTNEAIQRVEEHAEPTWMDRAYATCLELSRVLPEWSTDNFWGAMELAFPNVTTHEPRALGAVMRRLKKDGIIAVEPVRYIRSSLVRNHQRPVPVNRSLLFVVPAGAQPCSACQHVRDAHASGVGQCLRWCPCLGYVR